MKSPKTSKKVAQKYSASIKVLGKTYTAEGESVADVLSRLDSPPVAKGISMLIVSRGTESKARILSSIAVSRLFSPSKTVRELAIKNTALLFGI